MTLAYTAKATPWLPHVVGGGQRVVVTVEAVVTLVVRLIVRVAVNATVAVTVRMTVATIEETVAVDVKERVVVDVVEALTTCTRVVSDVTDCVTKTFWTVLTIDVRMFVCVCTLVVKPVTVVPAVANCVSVVDTVATWVCSDVTVLKSVARIVEVVV